jgi:hypothetical protein
MKTILLKSSIYFFLPIILLLIGCQKDVQDPLSFSVRYNSQDFSLRTTADMEKFARIFANYGSSVKLDNLHLTDEVYSDGEYKFVRGIALKEAESTVFAIPLSRKTSMTRDLLPPLTLIPEGCTMECKSNLLCSGACDQTVHEPCARQTCACKGGGGGCSASISYP